MAKARRIQRAIGAIVARGQRFLWASRRGVEVAAFTRDGRSRGVRVPGGWRGQGRRGYERSVLAAEVGGAMDPESGHGSGRRAGIIKIRRRLVGVQRGPDALLAIGAEAEMLLVIGVRE